MRNRLCQALVAAVAVIFTGPGAAAEREVMFERDVRPILKTHCFQCHGEEAKPKGKLDLRLRRTAVSGGKSGPAVEPGKPDASLLVQRLANQEMPPPEV